MSFRLSVNTKENVQSEELKRRLLDCVTSEKVNLTQLFEEFNSQSYPDDASYMQLCKVTLETIDKVLKSGNWEDSLFLHNIVKPLKKVREEILQLLQRLEGNDPLSSVEVPQLSADSVKLYISIFQNDGHNMRKWELQLRSIASHLMGRPVYQNEDDVKSAIRLRFVQSSEAYIVVGVKKALIQSNSHLPARQDRNGSILVALKPNAVTPENILEFVHMNKHYYFVKSKLVEQPTCSVEARAVGVSS
jgi:intracellular multiplication protein IcmQ